MIAENNPMEEDATLILWSICAAQVHFCQRPQNCLFSPKIAALLLKRSFHLPILQIPASYQRSCWNQPVQGQKHHWIALITQTGSNP